MHVFIYFFPKWHTAFQKTDALRLRGQRGARVLCAPGSRLSGLLWPGAALQSAGVTVRRLGRWRQSRNNVCHVRAEARGASLRLPALLHQRTRCSKQSAPQAGARGEATGTEPPATRRTRGSCPASDPSLPAAGTVAACCRRGASRTDAGPETGQSLSGIPDLWGALRRPS